MACALVVGGLAVSPAPSATLAQGCGPEYSAVLDQDVTICPLGTPGSDGATTSFALPSSRSYVGFRFRVGADPRAAFIYLGDQWYDLEGALYEKAPTTTDSDRELARWTFLAGQGRSDQRSLQLVAPEKIVQELKPNQEYTFLVFAPRDAGFNPSAPFTVRIALGPSVCDGASQEDPAGQYALALTMQPRAPRPTDLMTLNAVISPPYSDLFDFEWEVDGARVADGSREVFQRAANDLHRDQPHRITVTARGARPYPDPDQPEVPLGGGALSVTCTFRLAR